MKCNYKLQSGKEHACMVATNERVKGSGVANLNAVFERLRIFFAGQLKVPPGVLMPATNVRQNFRDPEWIALRTPLSRALGVTLSPMDMAKCSTLQDLTNLIGSRLPAAADVMASLGSPAARTRSKGKTSKKRRATSGKRKAPSRKKAKAKSGPSSKRAKRKSSR